MRHDMRVVLFDALAAADRIAEVMDGVAEEEYVEDWKLRSIVERQYLILGEALGRLRRDHADVASGIGSLGYVVDFRNVLAHMYDRVDSRLVYALTNSRLESLRDDIRAVME